MTLVQSGVSTPGVANVDEYFNLQVRTPKVEVQAGFAQLSTETDPGTVVLGGRQVRPLAASKNRRLRTGVDRPTWQLTFEGTNIAQGHISQQVTTMAIAQTGGVITLNSGNSVATAVNARILSYRSFNLFGTYPTPIDIWARLTNEQIANKTAELGIFQATGVAAPTDGIFFRWTTAGELRGICCYNSVEVQTPALAFPTTSDMHKYTLVINLEAVEFWIDGVLQATITTPLTQPSPCSANAQPFCARIFNAGSAPSAAPTLAIGAVTISYADQSMDMPWPHMAALMGLGGYQTYPGQASGQTESYANNAAPASASLSNTAAGYATLGGQFQFAAVASAETDFALFAFLVPAGSAANPGRSLVITGIDIDSWNSVAAVATSATVLQWALGVGSSALSLATADAATTRAPRRYVLGQQSFPVGAAVGQGADRPIHLTFETPLVAEPGTYVHVILKVPLGTATGTEIFRGTVGIRSYWQ